MKNSCSGIKEDWCCKGKSFVYCPGILKLLPLQGALLIAIIPRASPWVFTDTNLSPCKGKSFKNTWLEHDMIQYEKLGNCRLQSVQTIASFLYHFFYIPYSKFKKEVLSLPAKVSNKIKDDGKQKA